MGVLWARVNHAKPPKGWGVEVPPFLHRLGVSERVVVGGSFLAPLLILLVMPVLIDLFSPRRAPVGEPQRLPPPAE
jgi:hypothetical protein